MLSIQHSSNADWRFKAFLKVIGGSDIGNDQAVHQAFSEALAFAKEKGIPHSLNPENHAERYLRTRSYRTGPIIPRYLRIYCALKLRITCAEPAPDYGFNQKPKQEPARAERQPKPKHSPRMNMAVVRA